MNVLAHPKPTTLVGIAEMAVSSQPDDVLTAPHLGSCISVAVYDPRRKIGGMIHCLLPLSQSDKEKAAKNPCMYVDTGVAKLLNEFVGAGSEKKELLIYVAGGSQINDEQGIFEIGKKNTTIARKILWKNNLLIKGEHVGGNISRTFSLQVGTGEVWLRIGGETIPLS